jgi:transposase InsO family protein
MLRASTKDKEVANQRYAVIEPFLRGESMVHLSPTEQRRIHRWKAAYNAAEKKWGWGYVGLLPRYYESGNRQQRFPTDLIKLIDDVITEDYETVKQKNYTSVYGNLKKKCEASGYPVPSYKSFIKYCKKRNPYNQAVSRKGERAAYNEKPTVHWLSRTVPRDGNRIFHIGHIDHVELDLELRHSKTGRNMGRAWATFLVDAYSRSILAIYISYDPPSYRSCMMVLRECVRRHGRLPSWIMVDNGPEFRSTYFETLLAFYGSHKMSRPPHEPRFGSIIERIFETTMERFINNLLGNTQITKTPRVVTQSVNPKNHSVWTLGRLDARLQEWAYQEYNRTDHGSLDWSPREEFDYSKVKHGERLGTLIPYDRMFYYNTLPSPRRSKVKVQRDGVRVNYFDYWSPIMRDPEVRGQKVEVRYDPYDASIVYAYIKGNWVECHSKFETVLRGRSEKFIQMAAEEYRRSHRIHSRNFAIRAEKLAEFIQKIEAEELILQAEKDLECHYIINNINKLYESNGMSPSDTESEHIEFTDNSGTTSDDSNAGPENPGSNNANEYKPKILRKF